MARAASSMSLNILGFTAAVCAITAEVAVSTFRSALQHGQVTSRVEEVLATLRIITQNVPSVGQTSTLQFDGKDVKHAQQFPAQQKHREQHDKHSHHFSEGQSAAVGFKSAGRQTQNVQGCETEDDRPQQVVDIVAPAGYALQKHNRCSQD